MKKVNLKKYTIFIIACFFSLISFVAAASSLEVETSFGYTHTFGKDYEGLVCSEAGLDYFDITKKSAGYEVSQVKIAESAGYEEISCTYTRNKKVSGDVNGELSVKLKYVAGAPKDEITKTYDFEDLEDKYDLISKLHADKIVGIEADYGAEYVDYETNCQFTDGVATSCFISADPTEFKNAPFNNYYTVLIVNYTKEGSDLVRSAVYQFNIKGPGVAVAHYNYKLEASKRTGTCNFGSNWAKSEYYWDGKMQYTYINTAEEAYLPNCTANTGDNLPPVVFKGWMITNKGTTGISIDMNDYVNLYAVGTCSGDKFVEVGEQVKGGLEYAPCYEIDDFVPFSPIMRAYLDENNNEISKDFVHTCIISADCDENTVRKALDVLVSHHDILRGTFTKNGIAILPSNKRIAYTFNSINISDTEKAKEELLKTTLDGDKLVKVVFCKTEKENLICFTVHHFLIDLISWEILMKDFTVVVNQLRNNKEVFIPAKSASFKLWNEELVKYTELNENKKYWESVLPRLDDTQSLNIQEEKNEAEEFTFTFSKDISDKLVNEVNKMYGTRVNEILVTALGLAAGKLAGGSVGIMVESHGRTALNTRIAIERTVGWFTSCYPVIVNNSENIAEEIINTKETIRKIPRNGIEYLVLSDGFHKNSDIIFNFYKNSISNESRENKLVAFGGTSIFPGKINVNCFVADNILSLGISVPKCKHKPGISEELGSEFIAQIHKIVDYCTATDTVIKTRSDFSDDTLTQSELDELMELFD